jgi:hypothetical protein
MLQKTVKKFLQKEMIFNKVFLKEEFVVFFEFNEKFMWWLPSKQIDLFIQF